jgi:hypothetical protein
VSLSRKRSLDAALLGFVICGIAVDGGLILATLGSKRTQTVPRADAPPPAKPGESRGGGPATERFVRHTPSHPTSPPLRGGEEPASPTLALSRDAILRAIQTTDDSAATIRFLDSVVSLDGIDARNIAWIERSLGASALRPERAIVLEYLRTRAAANVACEPVPLAGHLAVSVDVALVLAADALDREDAVTRLGSVEILLPLGTAGSFRSPPVKPSPAPVAFQILPPEKR